MTDGTALHIVVRRKGVGDTIAITPLVRDLKTAYPNSRLSVDGTLADEVFRYDSRVGLRDLAAPSLTIDYKATHDRARMDHSARFLWAGHDDFYRQTGKRLRMETPRPDLVLSDDELLPPEGLPYIIVASGAKLDMPLKLYPHNRWVRIVESLRDLGYAVKQVGALQDHRYPHIQDPLPGAENLLGKTSLRQLFRLVRHAAGVVCHTSLPLLVASAFNTACVTIGGGREDPWLFEDAGVEYLHTIGQLACCELSGCRAAFPIPVHDKPYPPGTLCADPALCGDSYVGRCMTLISPDQVVEALLTQIHARRR